MNESGLSVQNVTSVTKPEAEGICERHRRRDLAAAAAVLLCFSLVLIGTYIPNQEQLSLFDEWVYLDYVDQMTDLGVAQRGEPVIGEALKVLSCRGVQYYGTVGSPCEGPYDTALYPQGGLTAADVHPPTYFALTAAGAALIRGTGISDDLLTSSRMTGAVFLFIGLLAIAWLALELGARLAGAVGVAGLVASLPLTRYTNSYLTPDNLNLAVGAAVFIAAVRFSRGQWSWWPLVLVSAVAASIKAQNGLAVGAAVLFICWSAWTSRAAGHPNVRRHLVAAAASLSAFIGVQLLWQVVRSVAAVGEAPDQGVLGPLTSSLLVQETAAFLFDLGLRVTEDADPTIAYFSTAVLVAGCIGAIFYRSAEAESWGVAAATVCILIVGSPTLVLMLQVVMGAVIPSPPRYGGALLGPMAAVTAAAFTSRTRSIALAAFGTGAVAIMVLDNLAR
jgi:hypothetical protein